MTQAGIDSLIRQLVGGDAAAAARISDRARTSHEPVILVAAALIDPGAPGLLERATELAATTRDRQLAAIAAAHLGGDSERVDALARDHLADYPDNILVAWIAAAHVSQPRSDPKQPTPHHDKEVES